MPRSKATTQPSGDSTPRRRAGGRKSRGDGTATTGGTTQATPGPGHNRTPDQEREAFLGHRRIVEEANRKVEAAKAVLAKAHDAAKEDGFAKKLFAIARDLASDKYKREQKVVADVKDRLRVAWWIGHPMGAQFDLFAQPDRPPSADRAYDEGKQASMENKPRKPDYHPSTEQYRAWMSGYNDHQATLAGGIQKTEQPTASGTFVRRSDYGKRAEESGALDDPSPLPAPMPAADLAGDDAEI